MKKLVVVLASLTLGLDASATTITVANTSDAMSPEEGSLRWAIATAASGDTIAFDDSLAGQTISLVGVSTAGADASLAIGKSLVFEGPEGGVTLNGGWDKVDFSNKGTRIVNITGASTTVTFKNIIFKNGNGTYYNNDVRYLQGGAIYTEGPLTVEDCVFEDNAAANAAGGGIYDSSVVNGGGAIYAKNGLTIRSCQFRNNKTTRHNHGWNIWGGAVTMLGGALDVQDSAFEGNSCGSYNAGGSFYLGTAVTSASFARCSFIGEHTGIWGDGAEGGGAIGSQMASGLVTVDGCVFRNCYTCSPTGKENCAGGAICCDGAANLLVKNSEFSGCFSSNGGAVYAKGSSNVFVNDTFINCSVRYRGAAVNSPSSVVSYLVNCTVVGGVSLHTADYRSAGVGTQNGNNVVLLNSVVAYNYQNCANPPTISDSTGVKSWVTSYCKNYNAYTPVTDVSAVGEATKMFASYTTVSTAHETTAAAIGATPTLSDFALQGAVVVPAADADPDAFTRTVPIDPDGVLASGGYPVKMTADGTYVAYSTDDQATWTVLCGNVSQAADAHLITSDQKGVSYKGIVPIGSLAIVRSRATAPTIGSVNVTPDVKHRKATVTLNGVTLGADEEDVPATSYDVYFAYAPAGSGFSVTNKVLAGQTAGSASFVLNDIPAGPNYNYSVYVQNSFGNNSAATPGTFEFPVPGATIAEKALNLLPTDGWIAMQMTGNAADFITDGEVVTYGAPGEEEAFAYAGADLANDGTTAGVPFHKAISSKLSVDINSLDANWYHTCDGIDANADYNKIMHNAFHHIDAGDHTYTLSGLKPGKTYLVQLIIHNGRTEYGQSEWAKTVTIGGATVQFGGVASGDPWYFGGTFVKVFKADAETYSFTANYPRDYAQYNAIQVRQVNRSKPGLLIIVR